jgi:hypothetical protein
MNDWILNVGTEINSMTLYFVAVGVYYGKAKYTV